MRLICSINNQELAQNFSNYLSHSHIENTLEVLPNLEKGEIICHIWVLDEDEAQKAIEMFEDFQKDPEKKKYVLKNVQAPPQQERIEPLQPDEEKISSSKKSVGRITIAILVICCALFLWGISQIKPVKELPKNISFPILIASSVYETLMFDYPKAFEILRTFFNDYIQEKGNPSYLKTIRAQRLLALYNETPYFNGYYEHLIMSYHHESVPKAPMFEKIKTGQIWRFFTPCLLHANFLHLFFNMIWFVILGIQIEKRLGWFRFLIFILFTGIISNIAQYLMTGPNFLGISGVVAAMAGFIWMRLTKAPWEGYNIQKATLLFLGFYIMIMFFIQLVSFGLELANGKTIAPNIANTAHIVGAIIGAILGSVNLFSAWSLGQRQKK